MQRMSPAVFGHDRADRLGERRDDDHVVGTQMGHQPRRRLLDENQELKSLVNLFQVSQTIANCLELERIYPLLMDALAKEIGTSRGLGYFAESGQLVLHEIRGVDEERAQLLGQAVITECDLMDDGAGNLTTITDPLNHQTTLTYNTAGQPLTITTPAGTTTLTYANGELVQVTDPLGNTTTRGLDGVGRLVSLTDPRGRITRYHYDALNQLTHIVDALGGLTRLAYDPNGNALTMEAQGLLAVCIQHEMDHLIGKVFLDRMTDLSTLTQLSEFDKFWRKEPTPVI